MADRVLASLFRGAGRDVLYRIACILQFPQAHGMAWMDVLKIDIVRCLFMVC